jgi:hypothetical protein
VVLIGAAGISGVDGSSDELTAINVGEVYAYLVRDRQAGAYNTPDFEHALHNARLIEAVRYAAEQGERQKLVEQIESFDETRVTVRS